MPKICKLPRYDYGSPGLTAKINANYASFWRKMCPRKSVMGRRAQLRLLLGVLQYFAAQLKDVIVYGDLRTEMFQVSRFFLIYPMIFDRV